MTSTTQSLTLTLFVSVVVPLVTLLVKGWIDTYKNKREADNSSKGMDLDALKEVRNNLDTIKQQNEEIVDLSSQLLTKKNEVAVLQVKVVTMEKQLKGTQTENAKLKENIEKMNIRIDALNKLVKGDI